MPAFVIIGAQWGDEGKGKATDLLAEHIEYVVKFNGGNNAGHTVVIGNEKYALHLLPSGILTPGVIPVISNGVVIDLHVLFEELDALNARGIDTSRLRVSANAHVITPYHVSLDKTAERFLGKRAL
jgi:adenylosuccinate synthase